ncbi:uncharacterized protein At4g04775-like [Chenopodium quinoa]|uniref:uncharacterized protein At4g04775-like n=1 Tax=Chenopodium quinoa TaxID=63459 RepID=UPI000B786AD6|nr:uncharacterized protein At4g04775-like [Chenopodium quinoa]XP_021730799.1 uncharacterized protein At4g04775-like [Chenopodium quinoa]
MSQSSGKNYKCWCGIPIARLKSWTHENPARRFEACKFYNPETNQRGCKFFRWVDEDMTNWQRDAINQLITEKQLMKAEVNVLQTRLCCSETENKRLKEEYDKLKLKLKKSKMGHNESFGIMMLMCVVVSVIFSFIMVKLLG